MEVDADAGSARVRHSGAVASTAITKGNDIIEAIQAIKAQIGADGADATTVGAWLDCNPETVRRYARKLAAAGLVVIRDAPSGPGGGRPKQVYDVSGGDDR